MKKIGFKNFRKFVDFPLMEYGPITFLVGRNNSGKSTFVKALVLINNYLKSSSLYSVEFSRIQELNVSTFDRILNSNSKNDDSISFYFHIDEFELSMEMTANAEDSSAKVLKICINDKLQGYSFEITPGGGNIKKTSNNIATIDEPFMLIDNEIASLRQTIAETNYNKYSSEYLSLVDNLNRLVNKRNELVHSGNKLENSVYSFGIAFTTRESFMHFSKYIISEIEDWYELSLKEKEEKELQIDKEDYFFESEDEIEQIRLGYNDRKNIQGRITKFLQSLYSVDQYHYISGSSSKQNALYYVKEYNNSMSDAINKYFNYGIELYPGSVTWTFTRYWMKEFEIGDDLKINQYAGEAYEVKIISNNCETQLADKGVGSIQAMHLILKLACIIYSHEISEISEYQSDNTITVIIEEPELNLHPALQSKLADLFLYVNQLFYKKKVDCKIEFIIETHSEYLIRKTQLLVKENEFEIRPNENPFHVIYFDKDMKQWKMNFREDGKFVEEFGNGFYDESSLLTLNLF